MEPADDEAQDASPSPSALIDGPDGPSGPETLNCAGPYDADRTAGGVLLGEMTTRLPHGWTVAEAISSPLSVEWHNPVIRWMLSERIADEDDARSYLLRQAILVWNVYTTKSWSESGRKGCAYALLIIGLESHGFRPKKTDDGRVAAAAVLHPVETFFEELADEGGIEALNWLLQGGFEHVIDAA